MPPQWKPKILNTATGTQCREIFFVCLFKKDDVREGSLDVKQIQFNLKKRMTTFCLLLLGIINTLISWLLGIYTFLSMCVLYVYYTQNLDWTVLIRLTQNYFKFVCVCVSRSVVSHSLWPHGLWPDRLLCPQDFPGNTGVDCQYPLPQRIFPTQGSNLGLWHCRKILSEPPGKSFLLSTK